MTETISVSHDMDVMQCGGCGITFAAPKAWRQGKLAGAMPKDRTFYCPNGCCRVYSAGQSKEDELRREIQRKEQLLAMYASEFNDEREAHNRTKMSLRSQKAAKTMLKRRVASGKCPCCSEHFSNLERHMKSAHPDGKVVPIKRKVA